MEEIWKPVKGREEYYLVSNTGKIKSLVNRYKTKGHYELKQTKTKEGYCFLDLAKPELKRCLVHRLVAEAFCEKPEGCNVVNHLDNNPSNNNSSNLEWTTYSGNLLHAQKQGRLFEAQSKGGRITAALATEALMKSTEQMVGNTYGYLTVLSVGNTKVYGNANRPRLVCKCSCGAVTEYFKIQLEKGKSVSCRSCAMKRSGYRLRQSNIDKLKGVSAGGSLLFTGNSNNSEDIPLAKVKVELLDTNTNTTQWMAYSFAISQKFISKHNDIV
jgi:hypothetical protein